MLMTRSSRTTILLRHRAVSRPGLRNAPFLLVAALMLAATPPFAIRAAELPRGHDVDGPHNWISNPSFEDGEDDDPVDWRFFREHEDSVGRCGRGLGRDGSGGATIEGRGGLTFGRWITPYRIPLEPATQYRVSFWYRGQGAQVAIVGHRIDVDGHGRLSIDLMNPFQRVIAEPESTDSWRLVEATFTTPGKPVWGQLCLSVKGRNTCGFDDISLERPGLSLLAPTIPQLCPTGSRHSMRLRAPELVSLDEAAVTWEIGKGLTLLAARKDDASASWILDIVVDTSCDLEIRARSSGGTTLTISRPSFFRTLPPSDQKLFTFAAITDTHFYRPGANERNDLFGGIAATINALDPTFVLSLGDQMEAHNGRRDEDKKLICHAVTEQLGKLSMPFFAIAGNHEIDRSYEGAGTRWYHEKYLGFPRFWSFGIGDVTFVGVDVSSPGMASREHGASFLDARQDEWLETLLSQKERSRTIVAGHISPFGEWANRPDRDRFLSLLLGNRVDLYLCGHTHFTNDVAVPHGQHSPPWPRPVECGPAGFMPADEALDTTTTLLTTTTTCAFPLGEKRTRGYRYFLVRRGRVVWQDVLPPSLQVTRTTTTESRLEFLIRNGDEKAIAGLPLVAQVQTPAHVTVDGKPLACETEDTGDGRVRIVAHVDVPKGSSIRVIMDHGPQP